MWLAPLRWPLALLAGASLELISSLWISGGAGLGILMAGYVLLLCFAARNIAVIGSVLVIIGLVSNLAVMALDGGMPVRGVSASSGFGPRHHAERPGDQLTALSDVIPVGPLGEVFSPGDVVLAAGVAAMVVSVTAPARRRRRAAAGH